MTTPLLSILIPTVVGREEQLNRLLLRIGCLTNWPEWAERSSLNDHRVEVVIKKDNKEMTIGEKREKLYQMAQGMYVWQIDDDDDISDDAISEILSVVRYEPDCITFEEHIDIDGVIERSNHSRNYGGWEGQGGKELWDGFHYHRTPFFKSVIKTDIAKSVPVPHERWGEDDLWSQALKPHLRNEIHIDSQLYRYIHRSSNFNERYGIK